MTEKKKRGLLSWLGFGDEDQAKQPVEEKQQNQVEEAGEDAQAVEQTPQDSDTKLAEAEAEA
ncbi:hypothetical protein AKJ31_20705, partial [Vibrio hepatarius]